MCCDSQLKPCSLDARLLQLSTLALTQVWLRLSTLKPCSLDARLLNSQAFNSQALLIGRAPPPALYIGSNTGVVATLNSQALLIWTRASYQLSTLKPWLYIGSNTGVVATLNSQALLIWTRASSSLPTGLRLNSQALLIGRAPPPALYIGSNTGVVATLNSQALLIWTRASSSSLHWL